MRANGVSFSIVSQAAWAPGMDTPDAWAAWAEMPFHLGGEGEPAVAGMPSMLRRRAGFLGKMALEVAYRCLDGRTGIPGVFCSRHGEVARAVDLLSDLAQDGALSPTAFGLAVHNASAGLFSIARADQANHQALSAGVAGVEHAVIEACSLLADGAPLVLLVAYDNRLPTVFSGFEDCREQPHAWAWLMAPAGADSLRLSWSASSAAAGAVAGSTGAMPASLEVLRFQLSGGRQFERIAEHRHWCWERHV